MTVLVIDLLETVHIHDKKRMVHFRLCLLQKGINLLFCILLVVEPSQRIALCIVQKLPIPGYH